ncbi:DUF202 domain-containing protein [Microbacterium karelineae]|uniref:DUF202 domain-containing protein n=1 Tax=Microbacterium karelineae TaxID=2654283 RepID=UPI0012EA6F3D|nr:DUF202 domain-containing protein [Microbacterium karelineae]
MTSHEIFDPGLQPERTLLAWRRTCLAFALASLIGARFTIDALGVFAVVVGILGAGLAAAAYFAAAFGYQRAQRALHAHGGSGTTGMPIALATGAALLVGLACAAFIAVGTLNG